MKFRVRRNYSVEAVQYDPDNRDKALSFDMRVIWAPKPYFPEDDRNPPVLLVHTHDGIIEVLPGWWIVRKANGDMTVRSAEDFSVLYEPDE